MYVKSEVRKGLLGRMLVEMLDTRVMIKQAMKGVKDDKVISMSPPPTYLLTRRADIAEDSRRSPAGVEIHCERHIRIYECNFLWQNACC